MSRVLSGLAILAVCVAAVSLLYPGPFADVFFAGWVLAGVGLAIVGAIGAWTDRTPVVWLAALLLTGLSVLGMWSIGPFVAPAALLLVGAAVFSHLSGPRDGVRQSVLAEPPTTQELSSMTRTGGAALVVGVALVWGGAFGRGLFGMCARETLSCVLATADWVAVGSTVIGAIAIGYGGFLLWKRVYVGRVLAAGSNPE